MFWLKVSFYVLDFLSLSSINLNAIPIIIVDFFFFFSNGAQTYLSALYRLSVHVLLSIIA